MIAYRQNFRATAMSAPRYIAPPPEAAPERRHQHREAAKGVAIDARGLLGRIQRVLRDHPHLSDSRLGRDAVKDPRLLSDLRRGRQVKAATRARINAYLDRLEGGR